MSAPTPTTTAIARLAAIDPPPDFGPGNELVPWLAAAAAGSFELPGDVLVVVAMAAHIGEEEAANVRPKPHRAGDVEAILSGAAADKVIAGDAAHAAAVARHDERERLLLAARRLLKGKVNEAFVPCRDSLIRVELREAVNNTMVKAREAAAKLGRFAPGYSEGELLGNGTIKELDVWRASRQLQSDFETLVAAWRASWSAATVKGQAVGREYLPLRPGGYYCWADPDPITDDALRYGHDSEVLRVVVAGSEYRLLAPSELLPLVDALAAEQDEHARHPARWIVRHEMVATGA